jgi:hypothetical protein
MSLFCIILTSYVVFSINVLYMYYYVHELIFVVLIHLCIFCSNVPDLTVVKFLPFLLPYSLNLYVVLFNICDCFLVPIIVCCVVP